MYHFDIHPFCFCTKAVIFRYVGKFQPRTARLREMGETTRRFTNVYVKNFADELGKEALEKLFSKFGKITSAAVMVDSDGKSKGFGFVAFENPEDAEKVFRNNTIIA